MYLKESMFDRKIKRVQNYIKQKGLEGALFVNHTHQVSDDILYYLFLHNLEYAYLFVPKEGPTTLFAIPFEVEQLASTHSGLTVLPISGSLEKNIPPLLETNRTYGIRKRVLPSCMHQAIESKAQWQDLTDVNTIMAIKGEDEIEHMRRAALITDKIYADLIKHFASFQTEKEVSNWIHKETVASGCDVAFPSIVASGAHAAMPHHHSRDSSLQDGFCVIDFGVRYKGYCSDMTRTHYIGTPNSNERSLYHRVHEAQKHALSMVSDDIKASDIADETRKKLGPDLEPLFIHSLGHGLGTQVHEYPRIGVKSDTLLAENMVITIEPGVYKKNAYGIRIEDDVVVKHGSAEMLTKSSKELIAITISGN